jgi:uncharacterized protein (TIGR01777 family)
MANILITGGTGLVGKRLTEFLLKKKHDVRILSRNPSAKNEYKWDVFNNYINEEALQNLDYIIHLAGAGIADKRWSSKRKKEIIDSRVASANLLFSKVKAINLPLKGFISASGSNFYGAKTTDTIYTETDNAGTDFLGNVCLQWENAAHQFDTLKIPVTLLRTGIVLSKEGGALQKMKTPIISPLGSGKQYVSWIHLDDLCNLYIHAVEQNTTGIFNAVAPDFQTSKSFSKILAKSIKRPYLPIAVPGFLLQLVFGELAVILLAGSRLSSKKLAATNFQFEFKTLSTTLTYLFQK